MSGGRGRRYPGPAARDSPRCNWPREQGIEFATSVNVDIGGEFGGVVWGRDFACPGTPILPKLRPGGLQREFATSVNVGFGPSGRMCAVSCPNRSGSGKSTSGG